ncbi:MAG TPA: tetratricopeptide repeat protein [Bryobacteraceae bacterium]|nr:tetratricopeptide repeat protein [Bryobacteraceae bacterium]
MPLERLQALKDILAQNPADALARYGLAMEYIKAGEFDLATAEFRLLTALKPDHAYAYFHAGQTLEKLGRREEARQTYREGVEAAGRKGDAHARDELQAALDALA